MITVTDQLQQFIQLARPAQRIISTVPSQTELLYSLGLTEQVIGITKFCIHPPQWKRTKHIIGGTKNLQLDKIKSLQPGLIIANKEENLQAEIKELQKNFPVFISDVHHLSSAITMIEKLGVLTDRVPAATNIIHTIQQEFNQLNTLNIPKRTAYLIWQNPYMSVGGDTFIHDMLQHCGLTNVLADKLRYPSVTIAELKDLGTELILLSTEPYPFTTRHVAQLQALLPNTQIILADGEYFSWYGSRLCQAPQYFTQLLDTITSY